MSEQQNTPAKLEAKIFVQGIIDVQTGIHIGGNSIGMAIGGADSVVVRNPLNNQPYIPGSSLRGKMRSLLERVRGDEVNNHDGGFSVKNVRRKNKDELDVLAGKIPTSNLGKFFGTSAETGGSPTRLIVRDCALTDDSAKSLNNAPNTDMPMTEVKTEVVIDRITSAATPRQIERVPSGSQFEFCFIIDLLTDDKEEDWLSFIKEGMRLIEADALGGSGSRGYGQVKFKGVTAKKRTAAWYQNPESGEKKIEFKFNHA